MNKQILPLAIFLALVAMPARAQVRLQIELGLPVAPPLVLIQPGIQVVEGFDEEVFFHRGWYWCRRPDGWYRARSPRARFGWVETRRVPGVLVRVPEGHYRNWRHGQGPMERRDAHERRDERREERREEHRHERREERREERHERQEEGRDQGRGWHEEEHRR
jgi:hypothetical protein